MVNKNKRGLQNNTEELLKKILIVQLLIAGVPQQDIRKIAGVNLALVTKIAKHTKVKK